MRRCQTIEERKSLLLVGKVLTQTNKTNINVRAMKTVFKNILRPAKGLVIRELDKNLFVFQFFSKNDRELVLNDGPSAFNGSILLLKEWTGLEQVSQMECHLAQFWVKAYEIPAVRQTAAFAQLLGNKIGSFVRCEAESMYGAE